MYQWCRSQTEGAPRTRCWHCQLRFQTIQGSNLNRIIHYLWQLRIRINTMLHRLLPGHTMSSWMCSLYISLLSERARSLIKHLSSHHSRELILLSGDLCLTLSTCWRNSYLPMVLTWPTSMVKLWWPWQRVSRQICESHQTFNFTIASQTKMMWVRSSKSHRVCSRDPVAQSWLLWLFRRTGGCTRHILHTANSNSSWKRPR